MLVNLKTLLNLQTWNFTHPREAVISLSSDQWSTWPPIWQTFTPQTCFFFSGSWDCASWDSSQNNTELNACLRAKRLCWRFLKIKLIIAAVQQWDKMETNEDPTTEESPAAKFKTLRLDFNAKSTDGLFQKHHNLEAFRDLSIQHNYISPSNYTFN